MTKKKALPPPVPGPSANISDSTFTLNSAANEFTRDAVVALAHAAEANGRAIEAAAQALTRSAGEQCAVRIGN